MHEDKKLHRETRGLCRAVLERIRVRCAEVKYEGIVTMAKALLVGEADRAEVFFAR